MSQIYTHPALIPFHETSSYVIDKLRTNHFAPRELDAYQDPERRYQGSDWKLADTGPPMSDQTRRGLYDIPAARVGDDYQTRPEISQKPPREQLPPLSSLFSAPRTGGPPPYLDRSPTFPSNLSPRDPRRSSVSVKSVPEPSSWELTNVQRHPSQSSSHYSYDRRPPVSTQADLPPPPGRLQISRPPNSPRFYEPQRFSPQDASNRTQLPPSINGWSPRSEPSYRGDYLSPASRDTSSFRPQLEQQQLQPATRELDRRQVYRDAPPPASSAVSQYPPTPASASSESLPAKDGLGPKIWTGTQFLPRYVRSADVPGEGLCYFYDDGTHCKTHIDGETVNAHWGVTKAGKPRKRLAIACITCREKKIKCDPDYPRCIQCEKFGRVCKFKNAPRGGQGSPETPPHDADELLTRPASSRSDEEAYFKAEQSGSAQSISSQNYGQASPEPEHPAKRRRYDGFNPLNAGTETGHSSQNASPTERKSGLLISRRSSDQLFAQWTINPYDCDEELVVTLMKMYFSHIGGVTYDMFPQKPFMAWLTDKRIEKSRDDLMLIYTMLALAAAVSSNLEYKKIGETYAAISRYACDTRHFSLQLIQSRLLLALYYYVNNNPNDSWDFCGSALRAATGMKLNQEIEKTEDVEREIFPFNLNRHGFAECRRRTFWCAYLMDRFNGFCSGHLSILHSDDVFLRLPCDVKSFNDQIEVNNPFFDPNIPPLQKGLSSIGMMAYLVNISSIWGDVMANVYRASQRPANCQPQKPTSFTTFYDAMTSRLEAWHASIPSCLVNTAENAIQATKNGNAGTFATIHSLYHSTYMKLNRYVSPDLLTAAQRERNLRNAHKHAAATLRLLDGITTTSDTNPDASPGSSPFVGFAVISALDILSAKGKVTEVAQLLPRFDSALIVLDDLAVYCQSARNQKKMMAARLMELDRVREGVRDESVVRVDEGKTDSAVWQMLVPLERTFARGNDCVYAEGLDIWERSVLRND